MISGCVHSAHEGMNRFLQRQHFLVMQWCKDLLILNLSWGLCTQFSPHVSQRKSDYHVDARVPPTVHPRAFAFGVGWWSVGKSRGGGWAFDSFSVTKLDRRKWIYKAEWQMKDPENNTRCCFLHTRWGGPKENPWILFIGGLSCWALFGRAQYISSLCYLFTFICEKGQKW